MKFNLQVFSLSFIFLFIYRVGQAKSIEKIVEMSDPKVVKVGIMMGDHNESICSGAFINKNGNVLTCAHCFSHRGIHKIFVKTDDEKVYRAKIKTLDRQKDLALLELEWDEADSPLEIVFSDTTIRIHPDINKKFEYFKLGRPTVRGQEVVLFGSPLNMQYTVSIGYVENFLDSIEGLNHDVVVQSAATNPGNSGGPLVDLHGNLVGVGESTIMVNPFVPATGMGFAVGLDPIRQFLLEAE